MVDYQYHGDDSSRLNKPADLPPPDESLDPDKKEEVVLDKVEMTVVECVECKRPLLNLLKTNYDKKTTRVQVKCIDKTCGGKSWIHTLEGDHRFSTIKSRDYIDSMEETDDELIFVTLKKHKEKNGHRKP